jgi:hypothetical protein
VRARYNSSKGGCPIPSVLYHWHPCAARSTKFTEGLGPLSWTATTHPYCPNRPRILTKDYLRADQLRRPIFVRVPIESPRLLQPLIKDFRNILLAQVLPSEIRPRIPSPSCSPRLRLYHTCSSINRRGCHGAEGSTLVSPIVLVSLT